MSVEDHPQISGDTTVSGLIEAADVPGVTTQHTDLPSGTGAADPDAAGSGGAGSEDAGSDDAGSDGAGSDGAGSEGAAPALDAAAERRALLELLIYAWDRARSPGVWERLTAGLAAVGVSVERPDGAPFDPARHEVGGVQPTDDDALVDTIAETEVVGFTDRGSVLREPIVVVYRRS